MATDPFVVASGDLATPALVAVAALVLFLVLLAFQAKTVQAKPQPLVHEVADLGDHGEKEIVASVFVHDASTGQVVRRSTRARKPPSDGTPAKAAEESTPRVKSSATTRSKTPAKTPSGNTVDSTPAADVRDEQASPPRTRSRRTPRA